MADPNREAVERGDEQLRASQPEVIDDPTVFVKSAGLGALTLVELAKVVRERTRSAALRDLAADLQREQESIRTELLRIAGGKQLDVPDTLIHPDQQMIEAGAGLEGNEFDHWAATQLVSELLKSSDLYHAARTMTDPQLAAFANRTLPRLDADREKAAALLTP